MWSCRRSSGWHGQSAVGSRRPWGWRKTILEDAIKGFFEIYKVNVQLSLQFCALLNDVSQGVYLFNASLPFQKPACSLDYDLCQDLAWHWQLGDASPVVAVLRAPFFGIFTMIPTVQSSGSRFPLIWLRRVAKKLVLQTADRPWIALSKGCPEPGLFRFLRIWWLPWSLLSLVVSVEI